MSRSSRCCSLTSLTSCPHFLTLCPCPRLSFGIAQVSDLNKTANTQQYTTLNGHDKPVVVATYNALGKQVLEVAT